MRLAHSLRGTVMRQTGPGRSHWPPQRQLMLTALNPLLWKYRRILDRRPMTLRLVCLTYRHLQSKHWMLDSTSSAPTWIWICCSSYKMYHWNPT